jgi:ABC-type glycerol-3-phosphate transport system permease component
MFMQVCFGGEMGLKMYEKVKEIKYKKKFLKVHKVSRSFSGNVAITLVLGIFALFSAFPLYYMLIQSLKPMTELFIFPPKFYVMNPTYKNFTDLFTLMSNSTVPFSRYIFNTVFITIVGTFGQVIISSLCAFPLSKHKFPGAKLYFKIIVLSLMFAGSVTSIPNYLIMANIGWVDTYWAIIIPIFGTTLGLYLMKQFMDQIHDSILESARIDGASEWTTFWLIVMPSVKSAWLTLIVFAVPSLWGMGANPFIYSEQLKTLPYALGQILASGLARAGVGGAVAVFMIIVPVIVFLFTQSNIIETMASSGIKE